MPVRQWNEIAGQYTDTLLLGNGASMAFSDTFSYARLYDYADEEGLLSDAVRDVFDGFEVRDFEFVLAKLKDAQLVNEALEIECPQIDEAYSAVRDALIQTVQSFHVVYGDHIDQLRSAYRFMQSFNTVFSLNYDLLVYWAALLGNEEMEGIHFKDCFVDGGFDHDWKRFREGIGNAAEPTLIFYPHGHLAMVTRTTSPRGRRDRKVAAGGNDLLTTIFARWQRQSFTPLFVCEGGADRKLATIKASKYLDTVFEEALPERRDTLAIFGWGMHEQDGHILEQLQNSSVRRVAVSVKDNNRHFIRHAREQIEGIGVRRIDFFDADSADCWIG